MSQLFSRRGQLAVKLLLIGLSAAFVTVVLLWGAQLREFAATGVAAAQPVPFSHKHHVGDVGLDCRYCHTTVETQAFPGMPATHICLTCHSQLFVDAPMLRPVHESAAADRPIAWTRVHKLPDFVYFDHSIHVAKGVGCIECHGRVDQMPLEWRSAPLLMQWCLECHRNPRPHLRPPAAVFTMTPTTAAMAAAAAQVPLQSTRRLTDCSTCHR
jgi:hypothetical protein